MQAVVAAAAVQAADPPASRPGPVTPHDPGRPPLVVVGDENTPPYLFRDDAGNPAGLVADAWALWSTRTGVRVTLLPMSGADAQARIADGRADVIDTLSRDAGHDAQLDFAPPYADVPEAIYAASEVGAVTDLQALRALSVGALAGDECATRLRTGGVADVREYPSFAAVIRAAQAGGPHVFCMDAPAAAYLLVRADAAGRFRQAFVLYHGQLHRAVRRGDAQTLALVERGFEAISPQEYRALEDKWLGEPSGATSWPRALRVAALGLGVAAVVALLWGLALRRAVRDQTAVIDGERLRLRTLINTLPDLIWFKSPEGVFLACNHRFEQFIGAPEARIVGRTERDFLAPQLSEELAAIDRRAAAVGRPLTHRFTLTYASDGHQEFVESLHTPVLGPGGELAGVLSIARDVTQRRDDERHLRRLNRLYQVLTNVHAAIARAQAPGPLFEAICRIMVDDGGLRMAWIGRPDHATGELKPVACAGATGTYLDAPHASLEAGPLGSSPSATAFREGHPVHSTDIAHDPKMAAWRAGALAHGYYSSSAFPLKVRARTLGVFTMYSGTVEFFDAGELALLERLSVDIGQALESYEIDDERERAVAALRDSEARFATVFKTSPVGIGLAHYDDKRYIDVNDSFTKLFGYSHEEAFGKNGIELNTWVDTEERGRVMAQLARDGEVRDHEARFRKKDGDVFHASFSAMRVSVGRDELVIASYFDLTAQRLATRTLEERQLELERIVSQRTAELSNLLDAMPDLFFRLARDGTTLDFRAGRKTDLFLPPSEFLGRRVRDVMPPIAAEAIHGAIEQALREGGIVVVEYPLPFPQGERYFEARLLPHGADQVVAVVRDITDRRSLEAERERARLRAVELANAKSEFLANMSHEIRTPLNGLLGLAQIGQRAGGDAATRETFAAILASGRLLLGIVNDVLDFSKIEVGKLSVEERPMAPRLLAEEAVTLLRERAEAKGIRLELASDPRVPAQCLGDALRTQQVLVNLISNAVKFTETGGVDVWVGTEPGEDSLPRLLFRVTDSGIGIVAEQLPQLFTPFQQADTSTTRRFGGTGLGLAISRRLAELMHGTIRVHSAPGQGSTFELLLPLVDVAALPHASAEDADGAPAWADAPGRLAGVRVLVAEDNEVNQLVLERALEIEGADVEIVGDGRQAVNRVLADGAGAFDVVLMDIQMPEMDGYEATRRILELAPQLPVIGQTAHAMQDERRECLAAGMVDHIAKPIDFRQLVDMIVRHLG